MHLPKSAVQGNTFPNSFYHSRWPVHLGQTVVAELSIPPLSSLFCHPSIRLSLSPPGYYIPSCLLPLHPQRDSSLSVEDARFPSCQVLVFSWNLGFISQNTISTCPAPFTLGFVRSTQSSPGRDSLISCHSFGITYGWLEDREMFTLEKIKLSFARNWTRNPGRVHMGHHCL